MKKKFLWYYPCFRSAALYIPIYLITFLYTVWWWWYLRVLIFRRHLGWTSSGRKKNRRQIITSSLLCFGGGVLLATCFIHMIPEASKQVNHNSFLCALVIIHNRARNYSKRYSTFLLLTLRMQFSTHQTFISVVKSRSEKSRAPKQR